VDGWADLARWAAERDLVAQSREAWGKVLVLDPYHPEAKAAVGQAEPDRTWKATEDDYRAKGYELFEGRWITRAERGALERERATEAAREQGVREALDAEARAREADARAREADAAESAGRGTDTGMTPAAPSDILGPSTGPRPTETYYTDAPGGRREPPPPPAPRTTGSTKGRTNEPPPPRGKGGVGTRKDPD
jgi:hypothetical protein